MRTDDKRYAEWRASAEGQWWKRALDVQRPYRLHLRKLNLGFLLDLGCGVGRNLSHFKGHAVGVYHNAEAIRIVTERGFRGFLPADFETSRFAVAGTFDSILCSHVLEHLVPEDAHSLLSQYLPYLRPAGRVVLVVPQERGYSSDPTHVRFIDFAGLSHIEADLGLDCLEQYSFPFHRRLGTWFKYNEFVSISRKQSGPSGTNASSTCG